MKITILTFIFALFVGTSFAQIKKGTWSIDGNSRITHMYSEGDWNFNRVAGGFTDVNYFFTPKLNVGTRFELARYLNSGLRKAQCNISPYFRYYFTPDKPLKLYGEVSLNFDLYDEDILIMFLFTPKYEFGVNYFVTPNGALEFGIGTSFLEYGIGTSETYFDTHFNLIPRAGIRLFFNTQDTGTKKYLPKDYLKRGNYSLGLAGYASALGDKYGIQKDLQLFRDYDIQSGYDLRGDFNYFLINCLSVGATLEMASYTLPFCRMRPRLTTPQESYTCEVKWRTGIVAEYTQPIDRKGSLQARIGGGIIFRGKSREYLRPGMNYRFTAKIQGFVAENISLWGGGSWEFSWKDGRRKEYIREVTFVGIQYYIMSKRNRK